MLNIRFLLFITLLHFIPSKIKAQQKSGVIVVSGKVIDEAKKPLPFATIALYDADSSLLLGGITNEKGKFNLNVKQQPAYVEVNFLGFSPLRKNITEQAVANGQLILPPLVLKEDKQTLDEVQIIAEKSEMNFLMDKKVFSVGKDLTTKGSTVIDVLDNVPSVSVDIEGNISIRGSGNLNILINGKPSALAANGNTDILKFIPADQIEKIEVMTNPSAKYDAEGGAGIINIIMKKDRLSGLHASISLNSGNPVNHGVNTNINWKKGKTNVFFNGGIRLRGYNGEGITDQTFTLPDTTYFSRNRSTYKRRSLGINFSTGVEHKINERNLITGTINFGQRFGKHTNTIRYETFSDDNISQELTTRTDNEEEDRQNVELRLDYLKEFKGKGHELEISVQGSNSEETEASDILETGESILNQDVNNQEGRFEFIAQADYKRTILKKVKLESGLKFSQRKMDNRFLVLNLDENGEIRSIGPFNDEFLYNERISAAYFQAGTGFGKFSAKAGLRSEYSLIESELALSNRVNETKGYLNFFPSAFMTYNFNKKNSLQFNYSRRISRPGFWYLNPFFSYSDSRNVRTGNPDLNPEFGNNFELGYLWRKKRQSFYGAVYSRYESPTFQRISTAEGNVITTTTINHGTNIVWGVETNWSKPVNDKIQLTVNGNASFFRTRVSLPGLRNVSADNYSGRLSVRYRINKTTSAQLSGNYRAPRKTVQGLNRASGSVNIGFSKDFWDNKASFGFNARDLFNTRQRRSITETDTFQSTQNFQWGAPWFSVNFTYYINKENAPRSRRRSGGGQNGGGDEGFM